MTPTRKRRLSATVLILAGVGVEIASLGILVAWPDAPLAVAGACLFVFGLAAPFYVVLAAHALGLGTCPIGLITAFDDEIKEELSLADEKEVVIGIALGYRDPDGAVNKARSERVPLADLVKWRE